MLRMSFSYDYKIKFNVLKDGKTYIEIHRNEFDFGDRFDENNYTS